jgi:hypothetical protein
MERLVIQITGVKMERLGKIFEMLGVRCGQQFTEFMEITGVEMERLGRIFELLGFRG